ncbi:MAG: nucleotidyltransferase substrate binding protein [Proteobacteria bacterium]|nr:nucleotidyltransferase substrate binding protein [Pseudomonadota bacterium]
MSFEVPKADEQFWKTFKKIAELEQLEANSPRQAIQAAFSLKVIEPEDEATWIEVIKVRKETSHTYNEDQAIQAVEKIQKLFLPAFLKAWKRLGPSFLL